MGARRRRCRARDRVSSGARAAAGLYGRSVRRRSGGDARCRRGDGRRSEADQPAAAGRARHRSFGAGRRVRVGGRIRGKRTARVRAQRRALRVSQVGPGSAGEFPRGSARYRHRPSSQYRVSRARDLRRRRSGRGRRERGRAAGGVSGYGRRYRFAHDDGQRLGCRRLGRRRDRSRSRDARSAGHDAHPGRHRLQGHRPAERRHHRDGSRAARHAIAAQKGRRREVRRVLRRGFVEPHRVGPHDDRQHVARVWFDDRNFPGRRADARLFTANGPPSRTRRARRSLRPGQRHVSDR